MNNIDCCQYENMIVFVKNVLSFYANEENYKTGRNSQELSYIIMDSGHQAKHALGLINELLDVTINLEYEKGIIEHMELELGIIKRNTEEEEQLKFMTSEIEFDSQKNKDEILNNLRNLVNETKIK